MGQIKSYQTTRLILRQWRDEDRSVFAAINSDPEVMRYFPRVFTREESNAFIDDNIHRINTQGWGAWAVEKISSGKFIGFVGFSHPAVWHPCAGEIDIGWRLAQEYWGRGYATEAAKKALEIGFNNLGFEQLVSFTSESNAPSIGVMKNLGMQQDSVGFEHPKIKTDSLLRKHVVYHLSRGVWLKGIK